MQLVQIPTVLAQRENSVLNIGREELLMSPAPETPAQLDVLGMLRHYPQVNPTILTTVHVLLMEQKEMEERED